MATGTGEQPFDPAVPKVQPDNYMFWSRPIEQPRPNEAGATAGEAIGGALSKTGGLIDAAANWANDTERLGIREGMEKEYDPVRDDYIKRLASMDDVVSGKKQQSILASQGTTQDQPADLKKFPGAVDDLIAMRDTGRLSPTYFDMAKDRIAKQWRSRFPGQVDWIDQELTRLTQRDPANKVIDSLTQDINAYASAQKEQRSKDDQRIFNSGIPGLYDAYKSGKIPADRAVSLAAGREATKVGLTLQNLDLENQFKKRELSKDQAKDTVTDMVSKARAQFWDEKTINTPWGTQSVSQFLTDYRNGVHPISDEQAPMVRQAMDNMKVEFQSMIRNTLNDTDGGKKHPMATYLGGDHEAEEVVADAGKEFDTLGSLFSEKSVPAAMAHAELLKGAINDNKYSFYKAYPWAATTQLVNEMFGGQSDAAAKFFSNATIAKDPATGKTVTDQMNPFTIATTLGLLGQTPGYSAGGGVFSLGEALKNGSDKGVKGPAGAAANSKIISNISDTLTHPDNPPVVVSNAAKATFGPEDADLMNLFNTSQIDNSGTIHPGKSTVFSTLVNDKVTKSIKKLGKSDVEQNYLNTSSKWFGNIFQTEISTLNQQFPEPSEGISSAIPTKPYQVLWNSKDLTFDLRVNNLPIPSGGRSTEYMARHGKGLDIGLNDQQEVRYLKDTVTKLNSGIHAISSAYHEFGGGKENMNAVLLQLFMESGLSPSKSTKTPAGQLFEALKNSQESSQKTENARKGSQENKDE